MFRDENRKEETPLIIVCDDKEIVYANYLIQLIGQKDDAGDSKDLAPLRAERIAAA